MIAGPLPFIQRTMRPSIKTKQGYLARGLVSGKVFRPVFQWKTFKVIGDRTMAKIEPDTTVDIEAYNTLLARLNRLEDEKKRREARSARLPGWYDKTADMKPPKDPKSKPGRFSAERILPGGVIVSFYVGGNGKLTVGSHYGTRGVTLWACQDAVFDNYVADDGDDGFRADRERVLATGRWETAPADGSDE